MIEVRRNAIEVQFRTKTYYIVQKYIQTWKTNTPRAKRLVVGAGRGRKGRAKSRGDGKNRKRPSALSLASSSKLLQHGIDRVAIFHLKLHSVQAILVG